MALLGFCLAGLLCGSCRTTPEETAFAPAYDLPADVDMNPDAGLGAPLVVAVRLADGGELPFVLDTGSLTTIFDKSLEPMLGRRLEVDDLTLPRGKTEGDIYAAPRLYLGHTRLMTLATKVMAIDLEQPRGHRIAGILGMDVLGHYCLQLDFEHRKIHFLPQQALRRTDVGAAYPLIYSNQGLSEPKGFDPLMCHSSLVGGKAGLMLVDTGCNIDGLFQRRQFQQARRQPGASLVGSNTVAIPSIVWDGGTYTNLFIDLWPAKTSFLKADLLGLAFLARHLVTLDFPDQVMYLKQTSVGPVSKQAGP